MNGLTSTDNISDKEQLSPSRQYWTSPKVTAVSQSIFDRLSQMDGESNLSDEREILAPVDPNGYQRGFPLASVNVKLLDPAEFLLQSTLSELDVDDDIDNAEIEEPTPEGHHNIYTRLIVENDKLIKGDPFASEYMKAASTILMFLKMRDKYILAQSDYNLLADLIEMQPPSSEPFINHSKESRIPERMENIEVKNVNGVFIPFKNSEQLCSVISVKQYVMDIAHLLNETFNRSTKSFCLKRLCLLSEKFNMHLLFNREKEFYEQKMNIHRDFYNLRKVDTLIDHASALNVTSFLDFVRQKVTKEADTEVLVDHSTNEVLTLDKVFEKYQLKARVFTVEDLEIKSYLDSFRKYERTTKNTEPTRQTVIGDIFLKRDNLLNGRFAAELTYKLLDEYAEYKFQFSELRMSFFGKHRDEWSQLADWFDTYKIFNHHVRWLFQIPRLYDVYRREKIVKSFQEILDNIFLPLFEVTMDPSSNPKLHKVLLTVVGFDTVDDDNFYLQPSNPNISKIQPSQWTSEENPHFCYWAYYLWANIYALNHLRKLRGFNTFAFRPHISDSGSPEHLMAAYLLSDGISRGAILKKTPLLQYLFYLKQIGISMSPLSDNKQFLKYKDNPFPDFFARGLNVSLSTNHPLLSHMTAQPLVEEYSVAGQVFDLNSCDLCELARNSVIQSGFEDVLKKYWIGENYDKLIPEGNDDEKTNVPRARYLYRIETLWNERNDLKAIVNPSYHE